jgi:F420-non-reducing hydrogenase large subunit
VKRISIDPITRLEGHGRIDIFLDDQGEVANCVFVVPEFRGFERLCIGRPVEEMPRITTRICGICPEAHHIASAKACDAVYGVEPPPTARKLRELLYYTFVAGDHALHFYALGGPDLLLRPDAPRQERNLFGVLRALGQETGGGILRMRSQVGAVLELLGGRRIHQVTALPGGVSKGLTEADRRVAELHLRDILAFATGTLRQFDRQVLGRAEMLELMRDDTYSLRTHSMALVDDQNRLNFYDGTVRIVDPEGTERARYHPSDYVRHIAEHVEPWTYVKFPYLKTPGWNGMTEGVQSGVYRSTPLARLNASDGLTTALAQEEYERLVECFGPKPIHATLATHWARLVELVHAAERAMDLVRDPEITGEAIRVVTTQPPAEGVGVVEAPRGLLTHHYRTDERGIVRAVNLIVGTTNNHAPIAMSIAKAARGLIRAGAEITDAALNRIEMAFRAYDPCLACATHTLPGQMPLELRLHHPDGETFTLRRD